ncbi:MAG: hypothetical protein IJV01_06485 [Bacteroidales bacterium]|nr:hypothetical protein [Bacteroidales bacterium]
MKNLLSCFSLFLLLLSPAGAQDLREALKADPYLASANHHPYIVPEFRDTPAPKGYKPFYVSHYGRHGSRYHTRDAYFAGVDLLDSLRDAGLLTAEGKALCADLHLMRDASDDLYGILTQLGSKEHQGIAERLYRRVPGVFSQRDRRQVLVVSSPVHRCLQSAANFNFAIKAKAPGLDIELRTGQRYMAYIAHGDHNSAAVRSTMKHISDSLIHADVRTGKTAARLFTDPSKVREKLGGEQKLQEFLYDCFSMGNIARCLDAPQADPLSHFTLDELAVFAKIKNAQIAPLYCHSRETGRIVDRVTGAPLLRDFVEKADEALRGNGRCADFRFGHDSGIGPLLSIMAVEGYDADGPMAEAVNWWPGWKYIPMGSNLQLIFYRKPKGEVLVKVLRNEEETRIAAVPSFSGPYYKWSDLRSYFLRRIAD